MFNKLYGKSFAVMTAALSSVLFLQGSSLSQSIHWKEYRNEKFRYKIEYPADWSVIEAKPRVGNNTEWYGNVLDEGEIQKVTFLDEKNNFWQADFLVVVLDNPSYLTLKEFLDEYFAESEDIISEKDTLLSREKAKVYELFGYDHKQIVFFAMHNQYVYLVSFEDAGLNDPLAEQHAFIYKKMLNSFEFISALKKE